MKRDAVRYAIGVAVLAVTLGIALWRGRPVPAPSDPIGAGGNRDSPRALGAQRREPPTICEHPYLPLVLGRRLRYRLVHPAGTGYLDIALESSHPEPPDSVELEWSIGIELGGRERVVTGRSTDCVPGTGAGEPWFFGGLPGLVELDGEGWLWPEALDEGREFGGILYLRDTDGLPVSAARLERMHRVTGAERIEVPAGTFETARVEVREGLAGGELAPSSVMWVARGVGLVRLRSGQPGRGVDCELVEIE